MKEVPMNVSTAERFEEDMTYPVKLTDADRNVKYRIREIATEDREMREFLFTLGCFEGETVTVISVLSGMYVISVKDARYSIDSELAKVIIL